jgi:hypothetical protein
MLTKEIAREEWGKFLNEFSRRHRGARVTLEILGSEAGAAKEGERLPLVGVVWDPKNAAGPIVEVSIGGDPHTHIAHVVPNPSAIRLAQVDGGVDKALQIESADAPTALVTLE